MDELNDRSRHSRGAIPAKLHARLKFVRVCTKSPDASRIHPNPHPTRLRSQLRRATTIAQSFLTTFRSIFRLPKRLRDVYRKTKVSLDVIRFLSILTLQQRVILSGIGGGILSRVHETLSRATPSWHYWITSQRQSII